MIKRLCPPFIPAGITTRLEVVESKLKNHIFVLQPRRIHDEAVAFQTREVAVFYVDVIMPFEVKGRSLRILSGSSKPCALLRATLRTLVVSVARRTCMPRCYE